MTYLKYFLPALLLLACSSPRPSPEKARLPLIIDADTANEVDDLFALVRALYEPSFELRAITSAQFHTSPLATEHSVAESQQLNEKLLKLVGRKDVALPLGANDPLASATTPSPSAASRFIIEQARAMPAGEKLHLVVLGSCTNAASAVLEDPGIIDRLSVHYLGFWHDPARNSYNKKEFNSGNDSLAVEVLLNTEGLELEVMSATTSQQLTFAYDRTSKELRKRGELGRFLLDRWDGFDRWWTIADPEKTEWVMWDVALVAALARPKLAESYRFPTPAENTLRQINIYTDIDEDRMTRDFWQTFPTP